MRFREHRGTLDESLETLVELPDRQSLIQHCQQILTGWFPGRIDEGSLKIEPYDQSRDERIGWDQTYLVTIDGWGPVGFTDSC